MLCCCERDEQTVSRMMPDYNIDLGERGVSSVPAVMAKLHIHTMNIKIKVTAFYLYNS